MAYENVSSVIASPLIGYVHENLLDSKDPIRKHILGRVAIIGLTPISTITIAVDTIIGLGACFAAILTVGKHKSIFRFARRHIINAYALLPQPYSHLLGFINPNAVRRETQESATVIDFSGNGFVTDFVIAYLDKIARDCYGSQNVFKRQVISRLTYGLMALACAVTRAVDGVIAVPAVVGSFCSLGMFPSVNNLAWRSLQVTGIIWDLFYCTIKLINPNAGV